uniref:NADH-ubiquinone oxidoreductase chain 3 n=1 Tax=Gnathostoma spinigerum TaxID=75299 RepID=A0A0K0NP94_9BILA|nr:NADH dehydrogenase subunit 3 [Gnathostoma spinigerum]AKM22098.1 NADH dehydrogenase subunit 3 [Gnathostoma spinigerum]
MFVLLVVFFVAFFLLILFYLGNFILSIKDYGVGKVTSFECGFIGLGMIQNVFSIHFFIMMLMFVVFDLEVVMFLGLLIADLSGVVLFTMLMVFVLVGFYMEWFYGKLVWIV